MNAPVQHAPALPANAQTSNLVLDPAAMQNMVAFADFMCKAVITVPKHLQGNSGDCLAVTMQAMQWGMNPFAVAQKSHLVNGTSQSFTVGNIKANSGQDWYSYLYVGPGAEYDGIKFGFWGNWSLIVVYKYDAASMPSGTKLKNINVFNGYQDAFTKFSQNEVVR